MRVCVFIWICLFLGVSNVYAAAIDGISTKLEGPNIAVVNLSGSDLSEDRVKVFQISKGDPRVVIDIKSGTSPLLSKGVFRKDDIFGIKSVRGALSDGGKIRFVLDLSPNTKLSSHKISEDKVAIRIYGQFGRKFQATMAIATIDKNVPVPRLKPAPYTKRVVVIDAGHGGHDPGAIGKSGLQEKKVTLSAALELRRLLLATGRYKVVLSRGHDRYVEHDDRLRVARANSADLFISIHADSTEGNTARGVSVYTLADRAKKRSKNIVNSQNWIMDVNLSEQSDSVGNILVDLAQRNTFSRSTEFADVLISHMGRSSHLLRNTHRRAGYYVLLAPDVPAVLLELGFLSNAEDERLLKSERHRQKLMRSVASAINQYFDRQNP